LRRGGTSAGLPDSRTQGASTCIGSNPIHLRKNQRGGPWDQFSRQQGHAKPMAFDERWKRGCTVPPDYLSRLLRAVAHRAVRSKVRGVRPAAVFDGGPGRRDRDKPKGSFLERGVRTFARTIANLRKPKARSDDPAQGTVKVSIHGPRVKRAVPCLRKRGAFTACRLHEAEQFCRFAQEGRQNLSQTRRAPRRRRDGGRRRAENFGAFIETCKRFFEPKEAQSIEPGHERPKHRGKKKKHTGPRP